MGNFESVFEYVAWPIDFPLKRLLTFEDLHLFFAFAQKISHM